MSLYEYIKEVYNADRLIQEIRLSSITIAFDYLTGNGSALDLYFKTDLSDPEKTTLDAIVANHSGEPMPDDYVANVRVTNTSLTARLSYPIESLTSWLKVRPRKVAGDIYINFVYFTTTSTGGFDAGGDTHFSISVNQAHTQTFVDFCPDYTYEAGGGSVTILSSTSTGECKAKFVGAPDYPVQYGGSIEFIRNKKLSLAFPVYAILDIDPKIFKYSAGTPGTNKLRLQIDHAANECISIEYYLIMSSNL